ncbi:MAG: protein kinase [Planctomycetes bacterium]|nr:protein kinase [Planctomycetota bacterium]
MSDPRDDLPIMPSRDKPSVVDAHSVEQSRPFYPGLPTGTGIGKYRILGRIRAYHNAVVYKARDLMLDRLVAIKQMTPELIDSPIACGNFRREAQFLARIPKDSRYILNIHELIEDELGLFIVEEYVPGHWLESLIFKRHIDQSGAYRLLKTASMGLRTLHNHMIVHRDIQPGNIMITKNLSAKLANLASAAQEGDLSPPPVITPQYAAPELLLEQRYDNRVDIYGLGMTVYEICVGRPALERHFPEIYSSPFPVGKWIEWQTDASRHLPDASELNPLVPPALTTILRKMTAKSLDHRYSSIDQVLEAVAAYLTGAPTTASARLLKGYSESGAQDSWQQKLLPNAEAPAETRDNYEMPAAEPTRRRTHTHTVRSARQRFRDEARWEWGAEAIVETPVGPRTRGAGTWNRQRRPGRGFSPPRPQKVVVIPPPPSSKPIVHKSHAPRVLAWTISLLFFLISVGAIGYGGWYYNYGPGATHPVEPVIAKGIAAYEAGRYEESERQFAAAAGMKLSDRDKNIWSERIQFWTELVQAQFALNRDEYEVVQVLLRNAARSGIDPAKVDELQQKAWLKHDAQRLASQGMEEIAAGNIHAVEEKLEEYAQKAAAVGLDPTRLESTLKETKQDIKQREYLQQATKALREGKFLEAITACEKAEQVLVSTATRELRNAIANAQARQDWIDKGDRAIADREFSEAERCYSNALLIGPDIATEKKGRLARAFVLLDEALENIKAGELLDAESKLKSSLWNTETPEVRAKLAQLDSAFAAARLVRRADRRAEEGDFERARSLYERALPSLPTPADERCRQKLLGIKRAKLLWDGDQALGNGDREMAEDLFIQARKLAPGKDVDDRLNRLNHPTSGPG